MLALERCDRVRVDGAGRLVVVPGVRYLSSEDAVLAGMLDGWRNQQLSRNLSFGTIEPRQQLVDRFVRYVNEYPWRWSPAMVDEFFGDLRSQRHARQTTVRGYQTSLRLFCDYVSSSEYGWVELCLELFGTHPVQVCHDWNTAVHAQESETAPAKRAFTRAELQMFFDYADGEVERVAASGRKGWLAAYRDTTWYKIAYGWGLRANETRHLQVVDFYRNAKAREFGRYGILHVRYGKPHRGSPPKRRSVLTVFDWAPDVVDDWITHGAPAISGGLDLFTTERDTLVSVSSVRQRFSRYCRDLNLAPGLDLHSLRRSYTTHLIEAGIDAKFVQDQLGHEYASTTGIYDCTSSDYRQRTLRRALDSTVREALNIGDTTGPGGDHHDAIS